MFFLTAHLCLPACRTHLSRMPYPTLFMPVAARFTPAPRAIMPLLLCRSTPAAWSPSCSPPLKSSPELMSPFWLSPCRRRQQSAQMHVAGTSRRSHVADSPPPHPQQEAAEEGRKEDRMQTSRRRASSSRPMPMTPWWSTTMVFV